MADDKKPKIDLKARLGKAAPAATPAPAPTPSSPPQVSPSGRPMPMPSVPAAATSQPPDPYAAPAALPIPTPMPSAGGLPGGIPVPAGYTPPAAQFAQPNPLMGAAAPQQHQYRAPAAPPEPQRIEIDELTIQQASKSSLRKGILMGCILAVAVGGVGYVAGGAQEQAASRVKSKEGAQDLATNAGKAVDQLKLLADKMEAGRKSLITDKKFPDTLARELGAINVDFDGKQLEGRRFSGYSVETTRSLVEFITAVQGINDRKQLIQGLLTKLEKPITEQLKIPDGQVKVSYVVAIDHDQSGNIAALLGRLAEPIVATGGNITLPADFTFTSPSGSGNTKLPAFKSGDIGQKPAAIYVVPKSFDTQCPSATGGQIAQLGAQIASFIADLKGDTAAAPTDTVTDSKPSLIDRGTKLIKGLGNVGG